jgi:hypothetical protein
MEMLMGKQWPDWSNEEEALRKSVKVKLQATDEELFGHLVKSEEELKKAEEDYKNKMLEIKGDAIKEFFDRTPFDSVKIDENHSVTISKPFSGSVNLELLAMGPYQEIQDSLQGAIQLDEASQSQMFFLNKYLGNYDINKIGNKFLIRNGSKAIVIEKDRW